MTDPSTRTMEPTPGVILPPPDELREYAHALQAWAQERPCESFMEALIRRLGFGSPEKLEIFTGIKEVIVIRPGVDLVEQAARFSPTGQGSLALMVVVRGLHQLMVLRPKPGAIPAEIAENIAALRRLEVLLDDSAPNTAGRQYLRRYRRSLVKRDLLEAQDASDASLSQPSLAVVSAPEAPVPRGPSAPVSRGPSAPRSVPIKLRATAPAAPVPDKDAPTMDQRMRTAATEAEGQVRTSAKAESKLAAYSSRILVGLLAVVVLAGAVQLALMDWDSTLSVPADISEVPVLSMTRHSTSVHVRVQPGWINKPLAARKADAEALFARLHTESDGAVITLTLKDPDQALLATVTPRGVVWEAP